MAKIANQEDSVSHTEWRQGDFALDVGRFLFGDVPEDGEEDGIGAFFEDPVPAGYAVISQTCDIVSEIGKSLYVAVCPLIRVDERRVGDVARGGAPRLGFVQNAPRGVVADLARPMTISKRLLSNWTRCQGFADETTAREFTRGIERAFGRYAFPDAFNDWIRPLEKKIKEKYGREEALLGKACRSLAELRVHPFGSWAAKPVRVQFLLFLAPEEERVLEPPEIRREFETALEALPRQGGFRLVKPSVRMGGYDDFSARDHVESVPLDMNALSHARRRRGA